MTQDQGMDASPSWQELKEEHDALAAHVERLSKAGNKMAGNGLCDATEWLQAIVESPATSLGRRDADTARAIHLALSEGADLNNLRKAPAAEQAVDFLLSLARQEWEKRRPMQIRRQAEEGRS